MKLEQIEDQTEKVIATTQDYIWSVPFASHLQLYVQTTKPQNLIRIILTRTEAKEICDKLAALSSLIEFLCPYHDNEVT